MKSTLTPFAVVTTWKGPHFFGGWEAQHAGKERCRGLAVAGPDDGVVELDTHASPPSLFHDRHKAAEDHALAVERHRIGVRLHAWISHQRLHAFVPHVPRGPDDPREDHSLVRFALDCHRERGHLSLGDIVAPALDDLESAV